MAINIVLFHLGKKLPEYLECTFKQLRLFNTNAIVWFLTDEKHMSCSLFEKYNINVENAEDYYTDYIPLFEKLYKRKHNDFWNITAVRFFYIQKFLEVKGIRNVYHFENDVLIYYSFDEHHEKFMNLYDTLAITVGGEDKAMTGLMYIDGWASLFWLTHFFIRSLKLYGKEGIKNVFDLDMVNEMTLIRAFMKVSPEQIKSIPTNPVGNNPTIFNSVFDPASWGQFVGGTTDKLPGAKPEDHYIGQMLRKCPEYTVIWKKDEENRKVPYFKWDDQEIKINNLHIHSKELHKYMSV
jgi:hypothetical protein